MIDEAKIMQYADGTLPIEEHEEVKKAIEADPKLKELYNNFDYIKNLFKEADETLNLSISKLIFDGPKELLDLTENTQPAIFLVSYSIFNVIKKKQHSILTMQIFCWTFFG